MDIENSELLELALKAMQKEREICALICRSDGIKAKDIQSCRRGISA